MPDAFFSSTKQRKRKRAASFSDAGPSKFNKVTPKREGKQNAGQGKKRNRDEELESDKTDEEGDVDDMDLRAPFDSGGESDDDDPDETPAEKRLRLAELYLANVKEDLGLAEGEFDAAEIDRELISSRLKQDVMEHSGKVHLFIADSFDFTEPPNAILRTRGHRFSVTSAVASSGGNFLFTAGKEGSINKWDLASGKKLATLRKQRPPKITGKGKGKAPSDSDVQGHTDEVLALALSDDGRYLASGGRDRKLGVWDAEKGDWIRGFAGPMGHRDLISCLSFRKGTHQLYTGSFDRTVKLYDLSPSVMGYVETLFGHQDQIYALDALRAETCVSVGARDKTARFWKIVEETQLVFRGGGRSRVREVLEGGLRADDEDEEMEVDATQGHAKTNLREQKRKFVEGSLETIAMIDETTFVSGGDSGSICLWSTQKKKPVFTQPLAHGFHEVHSTTEGLIHTPRWITALTSLRYSDLFASGSWQGDIRIWKLDSKLKSFSLVGTIPAPGVINSLQLVSPPKEFIDRAAWAQPTRPDSTLVNTARKPNTPARTVLLVAGIGQEHRLGRWFSIKDGATNGCLVVALTPRS